MLQIQSFCLFVLFVHNNLNHHIQQLFVCMLQCECVCVCVSSSFSRCYKQSFRFPRGPVWVRFVSPKFFQIVFQSFKVNSRVAAAAFAISMRVCVCVSVCLCVRGVFGPASLRLCLTLPSSGPPQLNGTRPKSTSKNT